MEQPPQKPSISLVEPRETKRNTQEVMAAIYDLQEVLSKALTDMTLASGNPEVLTISIKAQAELAVTFPRLLQAAGVSRGAWSDFVENR